MAECHLGVAGAKSPKKVLWVTVSFASSWCGPVSVSSPFLPQHSKPASPPSRLTVEMKSGCRAPSACQGLSCGAGSGGQCLCPTGMYLLNECCQWGDVLKPGEVSLGHGKLWGCWLPSSDELPSCGTGMTGLVVMPSKHTWEALYSFAWDYLPALVQHQPIWEDLRVQG